jgi:hypothetical protein
MSTKKKQHRKTTSNRSSGQRRSEPGSRLPAVGTVIAKRDRHGKVRCKCRVVKEGIRYNGTVYRSLSAAALAAAHDLGLESATQNGYVFWALNEADPA